MTSDGNVFVVKDVASALKQRIKLTLKPLSRIIKDRVIKMSCGNDHAAFITSKGDLCCTGDNSFGQCGTKPSRVTTESTFLVYDENVARDTVELSWVNFKSPTRVVDVVCGGRHTVCLDDKNQIYTFGDDSSIQLFLGDTRGKSLLNLDKYSKYFRKYERMMKESIKYNQKERHLQYNPVRVNDLGGLERIEIGEDTKVSLSAGDDFTIIALTKGNQKSEFICSGSNRYGQCGSLNFRIHNQHRIALPDKCKSIKCGNAHCLAYLDGNCLYGWGNNIHMQIPQVGKRNIVLPQNVYPGGEGNLSIKHFSCAYNNSAIITD